MRNLKKVTMFFIALFAMTLFICKTNSTEASIVFDPGHDSTHGGANGNGIAEETVNLKIARYCMEELEKYQGVGNIYMTRNGEGCPYPGTTSTQCNKKRVEFAKSMGAVMYVSFHNNSASNSSAKGASVYYPNGNYRSSIGKAGEKLALIVQNHLIALGLENKGTHIRNSEDNTRYPDGSLADYYGVIKNSKLAGFTAIIIEHAFISNASDAANYLSTDDKLKLLGIADATALAEYYGWTKKPVWDKNVSNAKLKLSFTSDNKKVTASVSGLSSAPSVSLAVWSEENGQDDLKWVSPKKNSAGNWVYDISLSDFKKAGNYNVHVYAGDGSVSLFATKGTFNVEAPKATGISVGKLDTSTGVFKVNVTGVTAKSGVNYVKVAVWTTGNQSDLKWITASKVSDGNYVADINVADYKYVKEEYKIHAYAADNIGIFKIVKNTAGTVDYSTADVAGELVYDDTQISVNAGSFPFAKDISSVKVAMWSEENSQDDIVWYNMTKKENNVWSFSDYFLPHLTDGVVHAHVYANMKNGVQLFFGNVKFEPVMSKVSSSQKGVIDENKSITWSGNRINVLAPYGSIGLLNSVQNVSMEAADVSQGALEVTDSAVNVTKEAIVTSGEAIVTKEGIVTSGEAIVTKEAIVTSGEAVVTGDATQSVALVQTVTREISSDDLQQIAENYSMNEIIYSIKDDISYYKSIKTLLSEKSDDAYKTFVIRGVTLKEKTEKSKYSLLNEIKVEFKLPDSFKGKDISIYEVKKDGDNITLGKEYSVSVTESGYGQITTSSLGDFVIASDKIKYITGDLNFDNDITLSDVVISLKAGLGIINLSDNQKKVADLNGDGKINITDAQFCLKIAVGIIK